MGVTGRIKESTVADKERSFSAKHTCNGYMRGSWWVLRSSGLWFHEGTYGINTGWVIEK